MPQNVNYFVICPAEHPIGNVPEKIHTVADDAGLIDKLQGYSSAGVIVTTYGTDGNQYALDEARTGLAETDLDPGVAKDALDDLLGRLRNAVPEEGVEDPGPPRVHYTKDEALAKIPEPNPCSNLHAYYNAFPKGHGDPVRGVKNSGSWWHMYWCH